MGDFISSHQYVVVDGVNLSAKVTEATLEIPQEVKDYVTAESNTAIQPTKKRMTGVQDVKLSGTMMQDMTAGSVNATLLACQNRNNVVVVFQMENAAGVPAAGNPVFTFTAVRTSPYKLGGKVGDAAEIAFEFMIASGVLDIDITP